jgi:glutamate-1-semialdehyde 2,1-aminomutase
MWIVREPVTPTGIEDSIVIAENLAGRYGMPKWQFTLSGTQANTEVIRLARP